MIDRPSAYHLVRPAQTEMRRAIQRAQELNTERTDLTHRHSASTFSLAKSLEEISEGQYAELVLGSSFRDFVGTMRDDNGVPRTISWAKGLLANLRKIRQHPELLFILENQSPQDESGFVTFGSAYYTAKLADVEGIKAKTTRAMNSDMVTAQDWEKEKIARLIRYYHEWGTKTTRTIKDRIEELKQDKVDGETPSAWPFHGGRIDPDVKKRYDDALCRLLSMEGAGRSIENLSYVQEIETLSEALVDILDAIDEAASGNTAPINSLIEQAAGESNAQD